MLHELLQIFHKLMLHSSTLADKQLWVVGCASDTCSSSAALLFAARSAHILNFSDFSASKRRGSHLPLDRVERVQAHIHENGTLRQKR